jgi:hypothetical protein
MTGNPPPGIQARFGAKLNREEVVPTAGPVAGGPAREYDADTPRSAGYAFGMSCSPQARELNDPARAEYHARWEAVESLRAQELEALTEERAWEIIRSLRPFAEPWRDPANGMGLVEQQRIFHKLPPS